MLRYDIPLRVATLFFACASMLGMVLLASGRGSPRLLVGIPLCAAAATSALVGRFALRRRARQEIMAWLPAARTTQRFIKHAQDSRAWGGDWEGLWTTDGPPPEELSGGLQVARTEIRDATRALLASLTEEVARGPRRGARAACRHARLRELGRRDPASFSVPAPSAGALVAPRRPFFVSSHRSPAGPRKALLS